jgi:threonyl-tRNA synthetase
MVKIKLPDGSVKDYPEGVSPRDVALGIGRRLADAAVAAKAGDRVVDLERPLENGTGGPIELVILTSKDREALDVLRHSTAHIMARAIMRLFPGVRLAFGPTTANGFYYDVDVPGHSLSEDDFPAIESEMARILKEAEPFERFTLPADQARQFVADLGQTYKVEHIDDELKKYPTLSFYRQGEFIDLCRGPHLPHAGKIGAFKILSIAGAYWKNDVRRKQLQRLYATAFFSQKDLDEYLKLVEEAKKRDHRVLGKQLKLFTISPDMVGPGLILWMPKGAIVRGLLEGFIKDELVKRGYEPVYTPHIGRLKMYEKSGHFPYYLDSQFPPFSLDPLTAEIRSLERMILLEKRPREDLLDLFSQFLGQEWPGYKISGWEQAGSPKEKLEAVDSYLDKHEEYLLKPMNCPHHIQIYKAQPHSYRDLPVRLAEFGTVYRYEQTGELSGMTRVRGFTQDDAHLFVTPEQIEPEMIANLDLVLFILDSLSLKDFRVRVGLRDPKSTKYVGTDEDWASAQATLVKIVKERGMNYTAEEGEAAFYGPKIDFVVRDCIGREWQLGTVQLDYNLPKRFELEYIGKDNHPHRPVMIHRAPFGSMERFCGILIEHFAGAFPLWLAPEQVRILPISEKYTDYGRKVEAELKAHGFRAAGDYRPEKIGAKIREAQLEKVPYMLVVGEKEAAAETVAVRDRVDGDLGAMNVAELISRLEKEVREKTIRQTSTATAGLTEGGAKYGA